MAPPVSLYIKMLVVGTLARGVYFETFTDRAMTQLLEAAFAAVAQLPEAEQDALGRALLAELASEAAIDHALASTPDTLARLADEAVAEYQAGQTEPLDPDCL